MRMRIMLVDDEPFFIEILKKILYSLQDELGITLEHVFECYSGKKALEHIPELQPDIVFTDIKMQAMDGIELAQTISQRWPKLPVVIISGYSSFDYARDALRANVMDYLVKPIEAATVSNILERVKAQMGSLAYEQSRAAIQAIIEHEAFSATEQASASTAVLSYPQYCLLLIQKIDSALDKDLLMPNSDAEDQLWVQQLKLDFKEDAWLFQTHNRKEVIVVLGLVHFHPDKIKELVLDAQEHYAYSGIQATVAVSDVIAAPLGNLSVELKKLHELLYRNIVIGSGTAVYSFGKQNLAQQKGLEPASVQLSNSEEKQITFAAEKKDWELLRKIIQGWFEKWQQSQCPSLYVELNLKRILYKLNLINIAVDFKVNASLEKAVGEIIYTSSSYAEAGAAYWELLKLALDIESSEQLFHRIEQYLLSNLSSPLSLTQLMAIFGVSSTYLCNIFRSFSGKSFVEYLTQLRIETAQKLMEDYPDMPLKDVAELVSYTDRHYFTKVFKAITGKTPTEYRSSLQV